VVGGSHWIADPAGVHALVDGDDQLTYWTRIRGWSIADEPGPADQVHIRHPDVGAGRIPYEALTGGWADLGWTAGPPPEPVDLTIEVAPQAAVDFGRHLASHLKNNNPATGGDDESEE